MEHFARHRRLRIDDKEEIICMALYPWCNKKTGAKKTEQEEDATEVFTIVTTGKSTLQYLFAWHASCETEGVIGFQNVPFLLSNCSIAKHSLVFPRTSDKFRTELQWLRAVFPQVWNATDNVRWSTSLANKIESHSEKVIPFSILFSFFWWHQG